MPWVDRPKTGKAGEPSRDARGRPVSERVYAPPKLHDWDELIEEVQVPGLVAVAVGTNRPALIETWQPDPGDAKMLAHLCRVLLATNRELSEHCQYLGQRVNLLLEMSTGMHSSLRRLQTLADFQPEQENED